MGEILQSLLDAAMNPGAGVAFFIFVLLAAVYLVSKAAKFNLNMSGPSLNIEGIKKGFKNSTKDKKELDVKNDRVKGNYRHINDIFLVITETTNVVSKISEIKYKGCLAEQMHKAEQHLLRFRSIFHTAYKNAVSEDQKQDKRWIDSQKFYQAIMKIIIEDIKDLVVRESFLNNHLANLSELDYSNYIDNQFTNIKNVIMENIDYMYVGDWVLDSEFVNKLHDKHDSETKEIIRELYIDARMIAIRQSEKITELEDGLKEFIEKIVGVV